MSGLDGSDVASMFFWSVADSNDLSRGPDYLSPHDGWNDRWTDFLSR